MRQNDCLHRKISSVTVTIIISVSLICDISRRWFKPIEKREARIFDRTFDVEEIVVAGNSDVKRKFCIYIYIFLDLIFRKNFRKEKVVDQRILPFSFDRSFKVSEIVVKSTIHDTQYVR